VPNGEKKSKRTFKKNLMGQDGKQSKRTDAEASFAKSHQRRSEKRRVPQKNRTKIKSKWKGVSSRALKLEARHAKLKLSGGRKIKKSPRPRP